jgi:hypothetical protein
MTQLPNNISFEEWVKYVFDHPVLERAWHWDIDAEWWNEAAKPSVTLAYLTRLFENGGEILAAYSDAQINQGLWFLVNNSCSNHMVALINENLPESDRIRCVDAIYTLFEQVFVPRCSPHLSHTSPKDANPTNGICYMWWDIIPIYGKPDEPARRNFDEACLRVMEKTLQLPSIACQENALHGLGHWSIYYQNEVEVIIARALETKSNLNPELRMYAVAASQGCIL